VPVFVINVQSEIIAPVHLLKNLVMLANINQLLENLHVMHVLPEAIVSVEHLQQ
jgi:hypothetical protein